MEYDSVIKKNNFGEKRKKEKNKKKEIKEDNEKSNSRYLEHFKQHYKINMERYAHFQNTWRWGWNINDIQNLFNEIIMKNFPNLKNDMEFMY